MPKFVFVYHGGSGKMPETKEEQDAAMAAWTDWFGAMGEAVVDGGNPVGMSKTVSAEGVADDGGPNPVMGYSLVQADDMNSAVEMARGCPIIEDGGSVEVAEAIDIGM